MTNFDSSWQWPQHPRITSDGVLLSGGHFVWDDVIRYCWEKIRANFPLGENSRQAFRRKNKILTALDRINILDGITLLLGDKLTPAFPTWEKALARQDGKFQIQVSFN